ncbi:hypothetical protein HPB48_005937 [Haemaphysalis longicornis]|uniref:Splicing factor 45 n=1 Tax=Haemaphysalis longicornis TaxID=44386 RepID=A0A9J6FKA7_HAELO|nr:hypothetical protein HPB48_005937 [Haemaphysalis longicornis]
MSLYDGLGLDSKDKGHKDQKHDLAGWSSGIKLLQSQLQLKKAAMTQPREGPNTASLLGGDWDVRLEYDPLWPNDYEKLNKERRERKEKEDRKHEDRLVRAGQSERDRDKDRPRGDENSPPRPPRGGGSTGVAIAPPPSLVQDSGSRDEPGTPSRPGLGSGSVAQRIMARYGYKAGQGLGKQEQGMSQALQVEKTSKRGGKIIHERDIAKEPPPPPLPPVAPLGPPPPPGMTQQQQNESITDMMRNPSKVVLLRNMVGPGEVDDDLEPETKEECSKYGEVVRCLIYEIPGVADEEAVRIFIEFKRLESAIKAVVDTNGRYFGGRIVKASFYDHDKFKRLDLAE